MQPTTETTLYMKKTFSAARREVFDAWTKPHLLRKWFAASEEYEGFLAEVDLRIGGKFRMGMKHTNKGGEHIATGIYKEIRPPEKLVFSWTWEGEPQNGETIVTIEFREKDEQTEMIYVQEFFPAKNIRDEHEAGWKGCFEKLSLTLQSK